MTSIVAILTGPGTIADTVALAVPCFVIIVAILALALPGGLRPPDQNNWRRRVIHVVRVPQRASETAC
jgi:hypothetical protein